MLGFIPARGGSKGVPGKNIKPLAGMPLIGHTIQTARAAGCFSSLWVSTDDPAIAGVDADFGVEVPWLRPPELATDDAPVVAAVIDTLDRLESDESVMLLQPTSPFRSIQSIWEAARLFKRHGESVISVSQAREHPYWHKRIGTDGKLEDYWRGIELPAARQRLPAAYRLNGAIYVSSARNLRASKSFYSERTRSLVMPEEEALDIDTPFDWRIAECLFMLLPKPASIITATRNLRAS